MMNESFKGNLKNTLIAVAIFLGLALAYSYPALQGNVLNQHDFAQWKSMSWEPREHFEETGETPLWSNAMFGGTPTYTTYMNGLTQVTQSIQKFLLESLPKPVMYFFFAMIGFFILLKSFKINHWWAVIGSMVYCFGTYNLQIIAVGHSTKMLTIAFLPIAIAGMIQLYRGQYLKGALLALIGLSFSIQNGMYQMLYYLLIILVLLGLGFFIKAILDKDFKKFGKATIIMILCGVLSVLPNLFGVVLTKEYGQYTMRGGQSELTINKDEKEKKKNGGLDKDYAFSWSQGVGETFTLFVPNLYGGQGQAYWGAQPFVSGPIYFGILTMLFLVLGLFLIRNRLKWVLFSIGMLGAFLAMGKNFSTLNYFLFDNLPMYNSFRTPSMAMTIAGVCFIFLAVWGVSVFLSEKTTKDERWKSLKFSLIIVGGLTLLLGVGSGAFMDFRSDNDEGNKARMAQQYQQQGAQPAQIQQAVTNAYSKIYEDRSEAAFNDGLRSLFILILGGGLLFLFTRGIIKEQKVVIIALGIIFVGDLLFIGNRYLKYDEDERISNYVSPETYDAQFAPRQVDLQIKQDPDPYYRVLDLSVNTYNNATQAIHHKCIGGYHPAKLENYQDLIDVQMTPGKMLNASVLNMLNMKYIITQNQQMYPNPTACGNAWFVNSIKKVTTADEAMLALNAGQIGDTAVVANPFKPLETAIVREKDLVAQGAMSFTKDSSSKINLTEYSLNHLNYESNNTHDGFAVFSDIYYPLGWKAYVDNKEAKIVNTNYALRGIYIPAGKHKVKFEFVPETYTKLKWLPGVSSILILLIILALGGMLLKQELGEEKTLAKEA